MTAPITIAAIDAGSNAVRMTILGVYSPAEAVKLESERAPVRLGHGVFTRQMLDERQIDEAVRVFMHFRSLFDRHRVQKYRAVATSAVRDSQNRDVLLGRIAREAGIELETIDGIEEARLVRSAVAHAFGGKAHPRLILDLGGGSLEINDMNGDVVRRSVTLPLGTVRLMESFGITGPMVEEEVKMVRRYVRGLVQGFFGEREDFSRSLAAVCGGNAEALARIAPAPSVHGCPAIDLNALNNLLPQMLAMDIRERMKAYAVRKDRAEVMGLAAIVLTTLGKMLEIGVLHTPEVGVREGVLRDLIADHFGLPVAAMQGEKSQALLAAAREFSHRLGYHSPHAEQVRHLAASLFDQLQQRHKLGPEEKLTLEIAAMLHDLGHVVNRKSHHKHSEYLVRHGNIPGFEGAMREMATCLVRFHRKTMPDNGNESYAALTRDQKKTLRKLMALLRIADGLDFDYRQTIQDVTLEFKPGQAQFRLHMKRPSTIALWGAQRKAGLFEQEFGLAPSFVLDMERAEPGDESPDNQPLAQIIPYRGQAR
ncbi:MAG: Exopolyphosphatase [Myxococcota bacterium]|nr:Exopolyphosphatase [Myxococcota bacterium]